MKTLKIALLATALVASTAAFADVQPEGQTPAQVATYTAPEGNGHVDTASYASPEGNGHVYASYAAPEQNNNATIGG
jgi:hypothetical protein